MDQGKEKSQRPSSMKNIDEHEKAQNKLDMFRQDMLERKVKVPKNIIGDLHFWKLAAEQQKRDNILVEIALTTAGATPLSGELLERFKVIAAQHTINSALKTYELERRAALDGLTNVLNREALDTQLKRILFNHRKDTATGVVLIDIDNFKNFNDVYGHVVGDSVLIAMTQVLGQQIRGVDLLGRYGGEEFVMVFPQISVVENWKENATTRIDNLRKAVESLVPTNMVKEQKISIKEGITASFGVTYVDHKLEGTPEEMLNQVYALADRNLYRAKNQGRNRVVDDTGVYPRLPPAIISPGSGIIT